jgi:anti-sigma regulatory factor (Ser/Thr protein kinase)
MGRIGHNPARIIPAWRRFLSAQPAGTPVRGVGEPVWSERSPQELVECQRHESLLNVAVGADEPFWLVCPYDVDALDEVVLEEAFRSHPHVTGDYPRLDRTRSEASHALAFLDTPLAPPPHAVVRRTFTAERLSDVRRRVRAFGTEFALGRDRLDDFELAVGEVLANTVLHGGGRGDVAWWGENGHVVCEVRDGGAIQDPLAGRRDPATSVAAGRGLWLVNQLCDLVQIRVFGGGTTLRLHMDRPHGDAR